MKIRKNYQYDVVPGETFIKPSRTQQHFKDECDVNQILKRYQNTGLVEHINNTPGTYGDVSEYDAADYQRAMNIVIDAQEKFDGLPSHLRKRFDNSPEEFLKFVMDTNNIEEAQKLGLINKPVENIDKPVEEVTPVSLDSEQVKS